MISIRNVTTKDSELLRNICKQCPPLNVHTPYTYWVMCKYYSDSCFILLDDNKPIGYIISIETDTCLFFWQIAVLEEYRGKGYSQLLIDKIMIYAISIYKDIEVTIDPNNIASNSAFSKYCIEHDWSFEKIDECKFTSDDNSLFFEYEIVYRATHM